MTTLLARLRAPGAHRGASGEAGDDAAERASILQHLQVMCATRRGSMRPRPDYGLPDVSEMVHSFPDAITDLIRAIELTITKYEPRLTNVRVTHVPSEAVELVVRFEISAVLVASPQRARVSFETRVNASREITVR